MWCPFAWPGARVDEGESVAEASAVEWWWESTGMTGALRE